MPAVNSVSIYKHSNGGPRTVHFSTDTTGFILDCWWVVRQKSRVSGGSLLQKFELYGGKWINSSVWIKKDQMNKKEKKSKTFRRFKIQMSFIRWKKRLNTATAAYLDRTAQEGCGKLVGRESTYQPQFHMLHDCMSPPGTRTLYYFYRAWLYAALLCSGASDKGKQQTFKFCEQTLNLASKLTKLVRNLTKTYCRKKTFD